MAWFLRLVRVWKLIRKVILLEGLLAFLEKLLPNIVEINGILEQIELELERRCKKGGEQ
jgi:hypothetical protein